MFSWLRRSSDKSPVAAARTGAIGIVAPWMRAHVDSPEIAGGFMTVTNEGEDDRLIAASSVVATGVELHSVQVKGSGIVMAPVRNGVPVPSGSMVLKPRGYHLLLTLAAPPLVVGTRVPVTVTFERAGGLDVDFVVHEPGLVGNPVLALPRE